MAHKNSVLAAAGLACLLSALFLIRSGASEKQPTIGELLLVPATNTAHRLYPGALDPKTGQPVSPIEFSVDHLSPEGVVVRRQVTYRDGTVEEISMQSDGKRPASSTTFYKVAPGEDVRRLKASRRYAADGVDIVFEDLRRLSGLRERSNVVDALGSRTIIDYAEDGKTHLREQLFKPNCCDLPPWHIKDIRWRNDEQHSLSYSSTYDEKTNRRTVVELDDDGNTLRYRESDHAGGLYNSLEKVYAPDTLKLRYQSKGTGTNELTFYRPDGTVERTEDVDSWLVTIVYFDASGKNIVRRDSWFHSEKGVVKDDDKANYWPYNLIDYVDGKPVHRLYFQRHKLVGDIFFNVTEGGVTYKEVHYCYTDDGFLETVKYYQEQLVKDKLELVVVRSVKHELKEGIRVKPYAERISKPARELGVLVPQVPDRD